MFQVTTGPTDGVIGVRVFHTNHQPLYLCCPPGLYRNPHVKGWLSFEINKGNVNSSRITLRAGCPRYPGQLRFV